MADETEPSTVSIASSTKIPEVVLNDIPHTTMSSLELFIQPCR